MTGVPDMDMGMGMDMVHMETRRLITLITRPMGRWVDEEDMEDLIPHIVMVVVVVVAIVAEDEIEEEEEEDIIKKKDYFVVFYFACCIALLIFALIFSDTDVNHFLSLFCRVLDPTVGDIYIHTILLCNQLCEIYFIILFLTFEINHVSL